MIIARPSTNHAAAGVLPGQIGRHHCTDGGSFSGSDLARLSLTHSQPACHEPGTEPSFAEASSPLAPPESSIPGAGADDLNREQVRPC